MALSMSEDEICASFRECKNPKKQIPILAQLNACGEDQIRVILEAHNIAVPQGKTRIFKCERMQWTPECKEVLRRMLAAGNSRREIADYFGCSEYAVSSVMVRMGIRTGQIPRDTPWRKFRDNRKKDVSNKPRRENGSVRIT